jgi:hypothetical protein
MKKVTRYIFGIIGLTVLLILSGCGSSQSNNDTSNSNAPAPLNLEGLELAPLADMPDYVHEAPPYIQEAYRFAVVNKEVLEKIPCYCGCNNIGHQDNYQCYVSADGSIVEYESHAAY